MNALERLLSWMSGGSDTYRHYVLRNLEKDFFRPEAAPDFAEYYTNWQLSLDGNTPGETREHHRRLAETAARQTVFTLYRVGAFKAKS